MLQHARVGLPMKEEFPNRILNIRMAWVGFTPFYHLNRNSETTLSQPLSCTSQEDLEKLRHFTEGLFSYSQNGFSLFLMLLQEIESKACSIVPETS